GKETNEKSIIRKGWPSAAPDVGRWLDEMFEGVASSSNNVNASVTILLQNQPLAAAAGSSYFLTTPTWKENLEKGVAASRLGVIVAPNQSQGAGQPLLDKLQECRSVALLYRLRALQFQSEGKQRAALDHLKVLLGLSRHLRNKTMTTSF